MGAHKGKSRAHQAQAQPPPQPSDYETDAPENILMAPPPPSDRSTEQLNLLVIRRHYPDVHTIHYVAPYAVLYTFSLETSLWEKVGVEGTLFVCELIPSPAGVERYGVVILNRRSMDNFYMDITGPDELEVTDEYIIMQGEEVYGLWIYCEPPPSSTANVRDETAGKIQELAERAQASQAAAEKRQENISIAPEEVQSSVPMGRQLSLRELFGQQREQDAAWSVINHHNAQMQAQHQNYQPTPSPQPGQPDMLSQLFMKAKQDYNNHG